MVDEVPAQNKQGPGAAMPHHHHCHLGCGDKSGQASQVTSHIHIYVMGDDARALVKYAAQSTC